jgi:hypothetical protein
MGKAPESGSGRVHWFGESWGAPICDPDYRVETPVGQPCAHCGREVRQGDQGLLVASVGGRVPFHLECFLTNIGAQVTREVMETGGETQAPPPED